MECASQLQHLCKKQFLLLWAEKKATLLLYSLPALDILDSASSWVPWDCLDFWGSNAVCQDVLLLQNAAGVLTFFLDLLAVVLYKLFHFQFF